MKALTKVVLDTNILISAIIFGGKPRKVLEATIKGQIQLVLSDEIIKEMRGVLEGKKFQYPTEITNLIIQELDALTEIVTHKSQANFIISGDVHLLESKDFKGTKILTPEKFLDIFD